MYKNCRPSLEERQLLSSGFLILKHFDNRYDTVLHLWRSFWSLCNKTETSSGEGSQAPRLEKAVPLQVSIKTSTAHVFPTWGSGGGLSVGSRARGFRDVNSRSEGTRVFRLCPAFQLLPLPQQWATDQLTLPALGHQQSRSKDVLAALLMRLLHNINLVKTCLPPQISSVTPPLPRRQFPVRI